MVLSEAEAQSIFNILASESHIPFDYPPDCCYSRAHEMCRIMKDNGIKCKKYWLYDKNFGESTVRASLKPTDKHGNAILFPDRRGNDQPIAWVYHVAPLVKVKKIDGTVEDRVIDPSISSEPIRKNEWESIMGSPLGSYAEESSSDAYFQNKKLGHYITDPTGAETKKQFKAHEKDRNIRKRAAARKP